MHPSGSLGRKPQWRLKPLAVGGDPAVIWKQSECFFYLICTIGCYMCTGKTFSQRFSDQLTVFEHFQVKLLLCSPKLSHTVIVSFLWTFFFWFQSCVKLAIHIYGLKLFDPFLYEQTEIECNGVENGDVTKNTFPLKAHSQYL